MKTLGSRAVTFGLLASGAAVLFAACLDDPNDPLQNEAPNRGGFLGGVAIGAGPGGGSGGTGAGLGTGGTGGTGGAVPPDPPNCACGVSLSVVTGACADCVSTETTGACLDEATACTADPSDPPCAALFDVIYGCNGDPACVKEKLIAGEDNLVFAKFLACSCTACSTKGCSSGVACQ